MTQATKRKIHQAAQVIDTYIYATAVLVGTYVCGFLAVVAVTRLYDIWGW